MAIRYDKKLKTEISNIVNRYNRKVRRLNKSGRSDAYIPKLFTKESLNELKSRSTTRKDLRRQLQVLESFTKRGAENYIRVQNKQVPRYLYKNAIRLNRSLSSRLRNQIERFKTTKPRVLGTEQDVTFAQIADTAYLNAVSKLGRIKKSTQLLNMDVSDLEKYLEFQQNNLRTIDTRKWKNNYLEILIDTAYTYGVKHEKVHLLHEKLKKLSPDEFNKLFTEDKAIQQIVFYYKAIEDIGIDESIENNSNDVVELFDELYENIDEIIGA